MAVKNFFLKSTTVSTFGELQDGASPAVTAGQLSANGWIVGKIAAGSFALIDWPNEVAAATFTTTDILAGANATCTEGLRSGAPLNGTFASANWSFRFGFRSVTAVAGAGRAKVQLWKGTAANGSNAVKIGAVGTGTGVTLSTSATTFSTVAINPGAQTFNFEYLFVQVEWEITTAGLTNTADVNWFLSGTASTAEVITSDFTPGADLTQRAFRFYGDGTESGSVALAAENTSLAASLTTTDYLLRIGLQETAGGAGSAADDYQLQVSIEGGANQNVTTSSTFVQAFNSANLADSVATTNRLSAGTGSFVAGEVSEDGLVDDWQATASNYTEHLFAVRLVTADLHDADTLDFYVARNGVVLTATQVPRITVAADLGTQTRLARSFLFNGTTSDLSGGGNVSRTMIESGTITTGTWAPTGIGSLATVYASFFSPAGVPGANGANGALAVNLTVETGNANLRLSAQAHRVNSAGVVQASGLKSAEVVAGLGRYWLDVPVGGLGTWNAGDRRRIDVVARNATTNTSQTVTLRLSNTSTTTDVICSGALCFGDGGAAGSFAYGFTTNGLVWSNSNRTVQRNASQVGTDPDTSLGSTAVVRDGDTGYAEIKADHIVNFLNTSWGFGKRTVDLSTYLGAGNPSATIGVYGDGSVFMNEATVVDLGANYIDNTITCIAVRRDVTPARAWFRRNNGTWNASGTANPSTNVGGIDVSSLGTEPWYLLTSMAGSDVDNTEATTINTGGQAFTYTQPAGINKWDGSDAAVIAAGSADFAGASAASFVGATAAVTIEGDAAFAGATAASFVGVRILAGAASFAGSSALNGKGAATAEGAAAFPGAGAASFVGSTAVTTAAGVAAFPGASAATFLGTGIRAGSAAFTGASAVNGKLAATGAGVAAFPGAGELAAIGASTRAGVAAFAGSTSVAGAGALIQGTRAAFAGATALTGNLGATGAGVAAFPGASTFTATAAAATVAGSAAFLGAATASFVGTGIRAGSAAFAGAGALSGAGAATGAGAASLAGAGALAVTATGIRPGVAAFPGASAFSASGAATAAAMAQLAGVSSFTAVGLTSAAGAGVLTVFGQATFSPRGAATAAAAAAFPGAATASFVGASTAAAIAAFAGASALNAVGSRVLAGAAAFTGAGELAAIGASTRAGAAAFVGASSITAVGSRVLAGAAAFTGSGALAGAGVALISGTSTAAFPGASTASFKGAAIAAGAAAFAGTGAFVALGGQTIAAKALFAGASAAAFTGVAIVNYGAGAASFAGSSTVNAKGGSTRAAALAIAGASTFASVGRGVTAGAASFAGASTLTARSIPIRRSTGPRTRSEQASATRPDAVSSRRREGSSAPRRRSSTG